MILHGGKTYCTASIISSRYLLTAAHCVVIRGLTTDKIKAAVGRNKSANLLPIHELLYVNGIFVHPNFNPTKYDSDIAILELTEPLSWSDTIRP